ncbi:O-methyltransferase [Brevundimonas sp.]|uniref:O-methyltransferase n=1 Tax=Brevundimonas sp. TaxID=1871086 RepID=UPI002D3C88CC|nr:O-methyltransferase [Brevundimonas sp.]HYD27286.1 O-methyltransferase [Brevundimonas sp.]
MIVPSFNAVNYSLRPSKTIQRGLIFEGLRLIQDKVAWGRATYIGLGSVWFTDFIMAHKILRLERMISIEAHEIGFSRAKFNKPYRFVRVEHGYSFDVTPRLFEAKHLQVYPSIIWLDYDEPIGERELEELRDLVPRLPDNSVLLTTFNATDKKYGRSPDLVLARLRELFGEDATSSLQKGDVRELNLASSLAELVMNVIANTSRRVAKKNRCLPAFNVVYRDKATMVSVGAVFPSPDIRPAVRDIVGADSWPGWVERPVLAPHLTGKEVSVIQAKLPTRRTLSRETIQALGFDLEDEQIQAFKEFYRHYPTFAQVFS